MEHCRDDECESHAIIERLSCTASAENSGAVIQEDRETLTDGIAARHAQRLQLWEPHDVVERDLLAE